MKRGDLVRFIKKGHTLYPILKDAVGIVVEVDEDTKWRRGATSQYLGAKVIVSFTGQKPRECTEDALEVISEAR